MVFIFCFNSYHHHHHQAFFKVNWFIDDFMKRRTIVRIWCGTLFCINFLDSTLVLIFANGRTTADCTAWIKLKVVYYLWLRCFFSVNGLFIRMIQWSRMVWSACYVCFFIQLCLQYFKPFSLSHSILVLLLFWLSILMFLSSSRCHCTTIIAFLAS